MKNFWLDRRKNKKMSLNARFLEEARTFSKNWPSLKPFSRKITAKMMEGQRLINEVAADDDQKR